MDQSVEPVTNRRDVRINIRDLESALDSKCREVAQLEEEVSSQKKTLDINWKAINELEQEKTFLTELLEQSNKVVDTLSQELAREREEKARLVFELSRRQSQTDAAAELMSAKAKEAAKEIAELKSALTDRTNRLALEEISFAMERKQKERYAKDNQELNKCVGHLEDQVRQYRDQLEKSIKSETKRTNLSVQASVNFSAAVDSFVDWSPATAATDHPTNGRQLLEDSREASVSRLNGADQGSEHKPSVDDKDHDREKSQAERLRTLKERNDMVRPHLKSSYAIEMPFLADRTSSETLKRCLCSESPFDTPKRPRGDILTDRLLPRFTSTPK